jgi:hypothetical protein
MSQCCSVDPGGREFRIYRVYSLLKHGPSKPVDVDMIACLLPVTPQMLFAAEAMSHNPAMQVSLCGRHFVLNFRGRLKQIYIRRSSGEFDI